MWEMPSVRDRKEWQYFGKGINLRFFVVSSTPSPETNTMKTEISFQVFLWNHLALILISTAFYGRKSVLVDFYPVLGKRAVTT